jgi:hypothetical protein
LKELPNPQNCPFEPLATTRRHNTVLLERPTQ